MNALNIFLATAGFIITMIGFGIAIIRVLSGRVKSSHGQARIGTAD